MATLGFRSRSPVFARQSGNHSTRDASRIVNIALIAANFALWILYELPHQNSAGYHAS
jgi:hypothetical protein